MPSCADNNKRVTCAMVLAEIAKSRSVLACVESTHIKKVLSMQLLQLEQVATIVQKGESVVVEGIFFPSC